MDNSSQKNIEFDTQEIITMLGIDSCSPELRQKIIAMFGKILFKRLLLLLPDIVAKNAIEEVTALQLPEGMKRLIVLLDTHVPDAASRRNNILEQTIAEFGSTLSMRR